LESFTDCLDGGPSGREVTAFRSWA